MLLLCNGIIPSGREICRVGDMGDWGCTTGVDWIAEGGSKSLLYRGMVFLQTSTTTAQSCHPFHSDLATTWEVAARGISAQAIVVAGLITAWAVTAWAISSLAIAAQGDTGVVCRNMLLLLLVLLLLL
jgi:hypothetical protein